jgi:hypothetical protein
VTGPPKRPIPALEELGRELARAVERHESKRRQLNWKLDRWLRFALPGLVVLAIVVPFTPVGTAVTDRLADLVSVRAERLAVKEYCPPGGRACVVVDGLASPNASPRLVRPGQALAIEGRALSYCPEAAAAYEAAGVRIDAFVGPCPTPEQLPEPGNHDSSRNLEQALGERQGH